MAEPPLLTSFSEDEFLIFEDNTCHLGIEADRGMTLSPSVLLLTNRHVTIFTQSPRPDSTFVSLSDITSVYEEDLYDCHVLTFLCTGSRTIHVFMPVESVQTTFCKLLSNLRDAFNEDVSSLDSLSLSSRSIVLGSRDLSDFYAQIQDSQTIVADPIPVHDFFTPEFARLIASVVEASELLFLFFRFVICICFENILLGIAVWDLLLRRGCGICGF
jgi:hypothetical protein